MLDLTYKALAADMYNKTGVVALYGVDSMTLIEENLKLGTLLDLLPLIVVTANTGFPAELGRFTFCTPDGSHYTAPYNVDYIPIGLDPTIAVLGGTEDEVDQISCLIERAYPPNTQLLLSSGVEGLHVLTTVQLDQYRTDINELWAGSAPYYTVYMTSKDWITVPTAFPQSVPRGAGNMPDVARELAHIYFYYLNLFDLDIPIPMQIKSWYARLFREPGLLAKKDFAGIAKQFQEDAPLRLKSLSKQISNGVFAAVSGETELFKTKDNTEWVKKLAEDYRAGHMDQQEFDEAFADVVAVVPDLYERAMRREDPATVLAAAENKLTEVTLRANMIADSLGIDKNPRGKSLYEPRGVTAAEIYVRALADNPMATMADAFAAYGAYVASLEAMQEQYREKNREQLQSLKGQVSGQLKGDFNSALNGSQVGSFINKVKSNMK